MPILKFKKITPVVAGRVASALYLTVATTLLYQPIVSAEGELALQRFDFLKDGIFSDDGTPPLQDAGDASAFDFSGDGLPGNQTSGGSRDTCPEVETELTALMPSSNFGQTTVAQPTFWFYVPYPSDQIVLGEFFLQDANGDDVGEPLTFALPANSPGLTSLTLPESLALETVGANYNWYFELYCGTDEGRYVNGWIQRVEPSPELEAQLAGELATDVIYGNNQIWFDAIAAIALERSADPDNPELLQRWNNLLNARGVELGNLPNAPFVGSVVIEE